MSDPGKPRSTFPPPVTPTATGTGTGTDAGPSARRSVFPPANPSLAPSARPTAFPPASASPAPSARPSSFPPPSGSLSASGRPPSPSSRPPGPVPAGNIKGFALERTLAWYAKEHGDEALRTILRGLPAPMLKALDLDHRTFGVIATEWYPAPLVHRMFDDMTRGLDPAAREAFARGGAEATVRAGLRGVYKVLFQLLMNPTRYAARAQSLWERYYDSGTMEKSVEGPGRHHTAIRDWTSHHPLLCEINAHSARIVYQELGCRNVNVERTGCIARGHLSCTQEITWDP